MDLARLLLFLHITGMFLAIIASYGPDVVLRLAFMSRQVAAIRGAHVASARLGPVMPILYGLAGIFGLVAAISFGYDLLAPWLVIAYVLFAAAMLTGLFGDRVFTLRLGALLAGTPDGRVTPELEALFASTSHRAVTAFNYAWIPVLVFDMVIKPFS